MPDVFFRGDAPAVADVWTVTLTGPATGTGTASVTCNGKTVSAAFVNTETLAVIAQRLADALANSTTPEFLEYTWTYPGTLGVITGTANVPGVPGVFTVAVTAAVGVTIAVANPTPASGPNFANVLANWSTGTLPGANASERVIVDAGVDLLYGLGGMYNPANDCVSTHFRSGNVGLPARNTTGSGGAYYEYRTRILDADGGGEIHVGDGESAPPGRVILTVGSGQKIIVHDTGTPADDGTPAVDVAGSGDNIDQLSVYGGSAGWAFGVTANGRTLTLATVAGTGVLWLNAPTTTAHVRAGTCRSASTLTTLTIEGGTHDQDDGTIGTITADAGGVRLNHTQGSAITAVFRGSISGSPPYLDLTGNDLSPRDLDGSSSFTGGAYVLDPYKTCALSAVQFDLQSLSASVIGRFFKVTRS